MDLLARKLGMKKGTVFIAFIGQIQKVIKRAKTTEHLGALADEMVPAVEQLGRTTMHIGQTAMSPDFKVAFAHSVPFLEAVGDIIMGWMLLWRAAIASEKITAGAEKKELAFYEGQIKSAEFFIQGELPVTMGKMKAILRSGKAAVEISEASFGG